MTFDEIVEIKKNSVDVDDPDKLNSIAWIVSIYRNQG